MKKIGAILILNAALTYSYCLGQGVISHSVDLSDSTSAKVSQDTVGKIFYSVDATLEPSGGMDLFFDRLAVFLDSSAGLSSTYLHFYVAKNGKLYLGDTSPTSMILNDFIREEKHWSPGIQSGPTKLTCVYVKLPIQEGKKTVYNRHIAYEVMYKSNDFDLYYSYTYPDFPYVDEIISVINDNGRYSTPIVHRGSNAKDVVTFLMGSKSRAQESGNQAERIYFYLLPK
ncbi:MAG: hypothetical protein LBE37_11450 [Sphingobacterium sp.]|jgi:hypothetical protein|nr:hypothetical protein [Sphingobacterium sp.]